VPIGGGPPAPGGFPQPVKTKTTARNPAMAIILIFSIFCIRHLKKMFNMYSYEPIAKVVIPVQTGIQKFLQHIEKTGFPLSWE
jgi:hypothetical protein